MLPLRSLARLFSVRHFSSVYSDARSYGEPVTATFFSLIVLALSAHITSWTSSFIYGGYYSFAALGIATAILTMLTLPTAYVQRLHRRHVSYPPHQPLAFTESQGCDNIDGCCGACMDLCVDSSQVVKGLSLIILFPLGFLWIMWLSVGASAASYNWLGGCGATYGGLYNSWYSGWATACHETRAVTALGFLTWLLRKHPLLSVPKVGF